MSESRHAEGVRLDSLRRSADAAERRASAATREANAQARLATAEERIAAALERIADHICGPTGGGAKVSDDRLAQIERYAKQPAIVGVLPQTHRMLPVADLLVLVEIAKAARPALDLLAAEGYDRHHESGAPVCAEYENLHAALARLDSGAAE